MDTTAADIDTLVERARVLAADGRLDEAEEVFERIALTDADHPAVLQFSAFRALQRHEHEAAEALLRRLLEAKPGDAAHWFNLALALYGQERLDESLGALDESLAADAAQPAALVYRGVLLEQLDRQPEATTSFLRAVRVADRRGMRPNNPEMERLMEHAAAVVAVELDRRLEAALAPLADRHGPGAIGRIRDGAAGFVGKRSLEPAHPQWRPNLFYVPGLAPQTFFPRDAFPWAAGIEAATAAIRAEMRDVLPGVAAGDLFTFYRAGELDERAGRRAPRTAAALELADLHRVPGYGPQAAFATLQPGAELSARHGPVNARVTAHLPLAVPATGAGLRVAGEERPWVEGELVLFDDSFAHEAWNRGDSPVHLLTFDVWNPALSVPEREAFAAVLSAARAFEALA